MNILAKNLLILASAGSGKTFQLANRVIGLIAAGVAPETIVALTFTRKAAGEFTDSVLMKLANAASNDQVSLELRGALNQPSADFSESLERVVRALPKSTFGTMDGFFAKVVRGFQYELGLTGGKFDLLEGPRAVAATNEILTTLLGETLEEGGGDEFLHAFRRANAGTEDQAVLSGLHRFVKSWQGLYRCAGHLDWGPENFVSVRPEDWEIRKCELFAKIERGLGGLNYTDRRQQEALKTALLTLFGHRIGSGSLNSPKNLIASLFEAVATGSASLTVKYQKEFIIDGPVADALRELILLAANCEMAAALLRTRAVREVVSVYDARCEHELRRRGLLGFDDVKILMGEWVKGEEARLRREAVDFRLDARFDHWLLDEFQDTSGADWLGLRPLIDEAAGEGEGSMFIVGDRKQAIYAWRGGDVGLFDEVMERYRGGLEIESMAESWRSCPEVLALVNKVCGDVPTMNKFFGQAANRWQWQEHVSAAPLGVPEKCGEARVEVVEGNWEKRLERLGDLLAELGIGERELSCGVLVRSNSNVREVADDLRARGFDVIEEGRREPAKDNPVGIALAHLLRWLANPADLFAREVLEMSPLAAILRVKFGEHWTQIWEGLLAGIADSGFAGMVWQVIEEPWETWSDFGRRRAGDIMTALAGLDAQGGATPQQAAEWIANLEVSQSPGIAAVQVMTIHKAKGLGFDVVVLPDIPNEKIPSAQYFDVAQQADWITETPPKWARQLIPEMCEAEASWTVAQRYEAFCMLYVALTRSKRGLYVLLEAPSKSSEPDKPSLANWLATAVSSRGEPGTVYQSGTPDWANRIPRAARQMNPNRCPPLAEGIARRERATPSGRKTKQATAVVHSASGMKFGSEVHAAFEQVGWIDEAPPKLPADDAGNLVAELLEVQGLRQLFERAGRSVEVFREQAVDAVINGQWLSGVVDRLHLHRDASGKVTRVEVIDFKTDGLDELEEFARRYSEQMHAYREVMQIAYPDARVDCVLLSTRCRAVISVDPR